MRDITTHTTAGRLASYLLAALVGLGSLSACGDDVNPPGIDGPGMQTGPTVPADPPESEDAMDTYTGPNDAKFRAWADDHEGAEVAVDATVEKVLNQNAFTLAGEDGAEALLVVDKGAIEKLKAGDTVTVKGIVHKAFDLPVVEDQISVDFDDDTVFEGFDRDPYIVSTDASVQ